MSLSSMIAALDGAIDSALAEQRLVGCVVLLATSGRVVHSRAAGLADRETARPMLPETWLRYASVTKPFTTLAALRLMDRGQLSPEDAVTRWLPGFAPALPDGSRPRITVDQLMAHMAGLDYGFNQTEGGSYARAGISDGIGDTGISLAQNLHRLAQVPLDRLPGTRWRYSLSTDVLGAVIEAVTDRPLPEAIANLVTDPLGIEAGFTAPATIAANYASDSTPPRRMEGPTQVANPLRPEQSYSFLPERIFASDAYPSGGGGMAGTAPAALAVLRRCAAVPSSAKAGANRRCAIASTRSIRCADPAGATPWVGAVITDAPTAGIGLAQGSVSWGGIYGHSWVMDPSRALTLLALTNTTTEGMNGAFAVEIAAALAP